MLSTKITDPILKELLKYTDVSKKGIEIAPYHSPILPKADGHNVFILDVFDTDRLRSNAKRDPNLTEAGEAKIEPVDFVGDACDIGAIITKAGMAGQFDYVISSHNFEHLVNPIKFLQGVSLALEMGGVLSMAIPDYRYCFDTFRLPTRLSDWLVAYHSDKKQPGAADIFNTEIDHALMESGTPYMHDSRLKSQHPPMSYLRYRNFKADYQEFCEHSVDIGDYRDAHCNVLFPELLELYLRDLRYLGLIDLELIEPLKCYASEFFVYLKKIENPVPKTEKEHWEVRQGLLRQIRDKVGGGGFISENIEIVIKRMNTIITRLERRGILAFFQRKNRKRLVRRRAKIDSENKHRQ